MRAVMYGAGNIGRGFIGALLAGAGYRVTFIDVSEPVVSALQQRGRYPVRVVDTDGFEDIWVEGVDAIDGRDASAVAEAIAKCDIMATAVGVNVLKHIAPNIAAGLSRRFERGSAPLDIIICENLIDANVLLGRLIAECLPEEEAALMGERVGLVEASIGRMVPVQTPEMQDGDSLRVCVERYGYLPVDGAAFRGKIPDIAKLVAHEPFDFYIHRKLYVHNMGHALCAYLGNCLGLAFIWQAAADPEIQLMTRCAMEESLMALCLEYGDADPLTLLSHIDDLLYRFTNRALGDTCARVGGDTVRKLGPRDRLIGAARLCLSRGVEPSYIAIGAAAAVRQYLDEQGLGQCRENAQAALVELSGLDGDERLAEMILAQYDILISGAGLSAMRTHAQRGRACVEVI